MTGPFPTPLHTLTALALEEATCHWSGEGWQQRVMSRENSLEGILGMDERAYPTWSRRA